MRGMSVCFFFDINYFKLQNLLTPQNASVGNSRPPLFQDSTIAMADEATKVPTHLACGLYGDCTSSE